jgi:hypothetical protein
MPVEMSLAGKSEISTSLIRINENLTDVVVVGYTTQSKTKVSAAVSKLNPEELKNTSNPTRYRLSRVRLPVFQYRSILVSQVREPITY